MIFITQGHTVSEFELKSLYNQSLSSGGLRLCAEPG